MSNGGSAENFVNLMLGWVRNLASWVAGLFQTSSGSSGRAVLDWLSGNWLPLIIILIAVGVAADWAVWLVRWRPYWLWFGKRRVILNDDPEAEDDRRDRFSSRALPRQGIQDEYDRFVREVESETNNRYDFDRYDFETDAQGYSDPEVEYRGRGQMPENRKSLYAEDAPKSFRTQYYDQMLGDEEDDPPVRRRDRRRRAVYPEGSSLTEALLKAHEAQNADMIAEPDFDRTEAQNDEQAPLFGEEPEDGGAEVQNDEQAPLFGEESEDGGAEVQNDEQAPLFGEESEDDWLKAQNRDHGWDILPGEQEPDPEKIFERDWMGRPIRRPFGSEYDDRQKEADPFAADEEALKTLDDDFMKVVSQDPHPGVDEDLRVYQRPGRGTEQEQAPSMSRKERRRKKRSQEDMR